MTYKTNKDRKHLALVLSVFWILLLAGAYRFLIYDNAKKGVTQNEVTKIDTSYILVHDTVPVLVKGKDLLSVRVDSFYYPNQNITVDTGAIINRYLSCYTSSYTYLKDSLYRLVVTDSVCRGDLLDRQILIARLKADTIFTIEKTIVKNSTGIYAGGMISQKLTLIPTVTMVRPKVSYTLGYAPTGKEVFLGFQYKIK